MTTIDAMDDVVALGPNQGLLAVMDETGDTKLIWSRDNADEVEASRELFEKLRKKGYLAFKVKADGSQGEQITKFDPAAEKIIMTPAMQGG